MTNNNEFIMAGETDLQGITQARLINLLSWHDSNKTLLKNKGSIGLDNPWVHTKIRDSDLTGNYKTLKDSIPGSPWNVDFINNFPDLIKIFDSLPLKVIHKIVILETIKECVSHIDGSSGLYKDKSFEPCNYRMLLRKSQSSQGFYLQGISPEKFGCNPEKEIDSHYPKEYYQPAIGKWWVLNNWCCQHGSDWQSGDQKVLISVLGVPALSHKKIVTSLSNIILHPDYRNN
jgi:hypothetical protein